MTVTDAPTGSGIIQVDGVSKSFGANQALRDVSMTVPVGCASILIVFAPLAVRRYMRGSQHGKLGG